MNDVDVAKLFPQGKYAWLSRVVSGAFPDTNDLGDMDPIGAARAAVIAIPLAFMLWTMSYLAVTLV